MSARKMSKELQEVLAPFVQQYGLAVKATKRHWKVCNCATGKSTTISQTPSDHRALANIRSDLRRLVETGKEEP